jgi:hypothetical protein
LAIFDSKGFDGRADIAILFEISLGFFEQALHRLQITLGDATGWRPGVLVALLPITRWSGSQPGRVFRTRLPWPLGRNAVPCLVVSSTPAQATSPFKLAVRTTKSAPPT